MLLVDAHGLIDTLDTLLDPALLLGVHDVPVFDARRAAIGVTKDAQYLLKRRFLLAGETVDDEGSLQVPNGESVRRELELGVHGGRFARQRVQMCVQVATHAIHVDELLDANLLQDSFGVILTRDWIVVLRPVRWFVRNAE